MCFNSFCMQQNYLKIMQLNFLRCKEFRCTTWQHREKVNLCSFANGDICNNEAEQRNAQTKLQRTLAYKGKKEKLKRLVRAITVLRMSIAERIILNLHLFLECSSGILILLSLDRWIWPYSFRHNTHTQHCTQLFIMLEVTCTQKIPGAHFVSHLIHQRSLEH